MKVGPNKMGQNVLKLRSGAPWERCRSVVLARESVCWLCGAYVDPTIRGRRRWAASVDHIYPLKYLRGLPLAEQRRLAWDPELCRLAHYGCNCRRGAKTVRTGRQVRTASRAW